MDFKLSVLLFWDTQMSVPILVSIYLGGSIILSCLHPLLHHQSEPSEIQGRARHPSVPKPLTALPLPASLFSLLFCFPFPPKEIDSIVHLSAICIVLE